jgi:protein TonB
MIAAGVAGALVLAAGIGYFAFRDSGAPEEISRATSSTTRSEPAPESIALAPARPPIESAPGAALEPGRDAGGAPSSEETAAVTTEQSPIEIDGHESTADETRAVSNSRSQAPFSATGDEPAAASVVAAGQRSEPIRRPAKTEPPRVETSSPSNVGTRPPTDPQPEPRVETIAPARQSEATTPTDEPATQPSTDPAADAETAALQTTPSPVEPPATQPVEEQRLEALLPPAVPDGPVKMEMVDGSFDVEPQLIPESRVAPRYPMAAQRMGLGGTVVVQAMILADGSVGDVRIVEDPGAKAGLGKAAATAVRKWRYEPAVRNGEPVDAPLRIRVSFKVK